MHVSALYGNDSPTLLDALVSGTAYPGAVLTQRGATGQPVAAWAMSDVYVLDDVVTGGDGLPHERLSFQFSELNESTSTRTFAWDLELNREGGHDLPAGLTLGPLPTPATPALTLDLMSGGSSQVPVSLALDSYSFGFHNTISLSTGGGGGGAGRATFDALQVSALYGNDSPILLNALVSGAPTPERY